MNKKGQVTVFIGIAIVMLIAIGAVIYFMQKEVAPEHIRRLLIDVPEMAKPIAGYIYACIDGTAPLAAATIAKGGGYIFPPNFIDSPYGNLAYGYRKGQNTLISLIEMQNQLAAYAGTALLECLDLSLFEKQGYTLELEEITAETQILPNKILFTFNIPMKVSKEDSTVQLNDFVWDINMPLGTLHSIAENIVAELQNDPYEFSLGFLQGAPGQIEMLPIDIENIGIAIRDPRVKIEQQPLTFLIVAEIMSNRPPYFTNLPNTLEFTENQVATFTVEAEDPEGDPITFAADPTLFDIDENTGTFTFESEIPDTYPIEFRVMDDKRNMFKKIVEITIFPRE